MRESGGGRTALCFEAQVQVSRTTPLGSREGPQRFAIDGLSAAQREVVLGDRGAVVSAAVVVPPCSEGEDQESPPKDPQTYKKEDDPVDYPWFYAWPDPTTLFGGFARTSWWRF